MTTKDHKSIIASFKVDSAKIPCSEEEKKIYGVDFKNDLSSSSSNRVIVEKQKFEDNRKLFYRVTIHRGWFYDGPYYYSTKEKALEAAKNAVENLRKKTEESCKD